MALVNSYHAGIFTGTLRSPGKLSASLVPLRVPLRILPRLRRKGVSYYVAGDVKKLKNSGFKENCDE